MILTSDEHIVAISDPTLNYIFRNLQAFKHYGLDTYYLNNIVQDFSVDNPARPIYDMDKVADLIQRIPHKVLLSVFVTCSRCSSTPNSTHMGFVWLADIVQCKSCNRFLKNRNVTVPVAASIEVYYP